MTDKHRHDWQQPEWAVRLRECTICRGITHVSRSPNTRPRLIDLKRLAIHDGRRCDKCTEFATDALLGSFDADGSYCPRHANEEWDRVRPLPRMLASSTGNFTPGACP